MRKGSDSGVGDTWCASLNYSEDILPPLPCRVVHVPSALTLSLVSHVTCYGMLANVMGAEA